MANEQNFPLINLAEELHSKKIVNMDAPARELVSIAQRFKQSPGGEVGINIIIYDNYFVVTPSEVLTSRPAELGTLRESISGKMSNW